MFFVSNDITLNKDIEPIISLLDILINKVTSKQCKVLFLKLMNNNEEAIASKLGMTQSFVNQYYMVTGWSAIKK